MKRLFGVTGGPLEAPERFANDRWEVALDGAVHNVEAATLPALIDEHGVAGALERCNGEFALAATDRRDGTVWLARDRVGVRFLYFAHDGDRFAFAARPRPLLALDWVSKEIDRVYAGLVAGSHYRTFDNDQSSSPYRDIRQLPPGHLARFAGGEVRVEPWWTLTEQEELDEPEEELAERYRELLLDAVGIRLPNSPAPAWTLSGGMDSSTVLACAVRNLGARQHAFSSVYGDSEYDESEDIKTMLDAAVEQWHAISVNEPDVLGLVEEMIDAHDEPVVTATWLSHHVVCGEAAAGGFRTMFGGLGGDELNAGEYEYFFYRFADLRAAGDEDALRHEVAEWKRHHDHPVFRKDWDVMEAGLARWVDFGVRGRILPDRGRIERYAGAVNRDFFDVTQWEPVMDRPFSSYLKNRTYQDIFRETAPPCLRAEDRQTAVRGMRNMDPFFDHRLIELMFRVPGRLKIEDGVTKRLLRRATEGLLPEETRTRIKKTGWNAPAGDWFSGKGRETLLELVGDPGFRAGHIYDLDEVRRLIDEHDEIVRTGRVAENHMMFLWQLVNVELWLHWLARV
jgi:asparagine synthase (glutamine-hydrolysing)